MRPRWGIGLGLGEDPQSTSLQSKNEEMQLDKKTLPSKDLEVALEIKDRKPSMVFEQA